MEFGNAPRQQDAPCRRVRALQLRNQREASIEDQVEVCRRYAQLQGWTIVEIYADRAQSGTSRFRPQFQQLEVDAHARTGST